jgi:hypothetical protein
MYSVNLFSRGARPWLVLPRKTLFFMPPIDELLESSESREPEDDPKEQPTQSTTPLVESRPRPL